MIEIINEAPPVFTLIALSVFSVTLSKLLFSGCRRG